MTARTITATFADGRKVERRTEKAYTHASRKTRHSVVRWHSTYEAARKAAGAFGEVTAVDGQEIASSAPTGDIWIVHYADGDTRDVEVSPRVSPIMAGKAARPGVEIVRAARKARA